MFAVILAGGAGTRLRPLTYARRKELIPLLNRPLLEYRLRNLAGHGVQDVILACSQGAGEIEQHFGDGAQLGLRVRYVYETKPMGSGRAVKEAVHQAGASGTLVVCNGDILTDIDLSAMIEQHRSTGAAMSISLAPVDDPWHFGVVAVDDDLRISHFIEKPPQGEEPSNLINAGTWLWEPDILARIPDDESAVRDQFAERVLFPGVIADGLRVQGFVEDLWVDVGAPDRYFKATRLLLERAVASSPSSVIVSDGAKIAPTAELSGNVFVGVGAAVGEGARVFGPTVIGDGATVGDRALIEDSIVWERASLGARSAIDHSVIGGAVSIGEDAIVVGAILADGAEVSAETILDPGRTLMPGERA